MELNKELMDHFKEFKLHAFTQYLDEVEDSKLPLRQSLLELCRHESNRKHSEFVHKLIIKATFPKIKTLNMLDYKVTPKLPKKIVSNLATCEFIDKKLNVVLVGDSGGGKTHLAIALGVEACNKSYSVKCFGASELVNNLITEHNNGTVERFLKKIKKYDLLIIDELGYCPFSKQGAALLFRVISDRYENSSLIITTNLAFSRWTELFIDKTMTTALLDRVTHNATIIKYDWGSVRFTETLNENNPEKEVAF
jgi:DNA replication protein DnaC